MSAAPTTNGLAIRPAHPIEASLVDSRENIAKVAPRGYDVDKLIKQAALCCIKNPELMKCNLGTIKIGVVQAAELGLDLAGGLPTAYLVPFKGRAQLIVSYRGLRELAIRSGTVRSIESQIVCERDLFEWAHTERGLIFSHRPPWSDRGDLVGVYAIATLQDGTVMGERMSTAQIEAIQRVSRGGDGPAWKNHWDEMARKTVVRRLCKSLVLSPEVRRAVEIIDEQEGVETRPQATTASNTSRLAQAVGLEPSPPPPIEEADEPGPDPTAPEPARTEYVEINEKDIPF